MIKGLRFRAILSPWEILSLQGSFRHEGDVWWPCTPGLEEKEDRILSVFTRYAKEGGRHPCLPPDVDDRLSLCYFQELFLVEDLKRRQDFRHRVQRIEDR